MPAAVALLAQGGLALLVFAVGLQSQWRDLFYVARQPRLLLSGIVAVNVIVPSVMVAMVSILPIDPITKAGLVAMAIAPMAPFLPGKMLKLGADEHFAVGLYVVLTVIAILVVPATLWAIGRLAGNEFGMAVGPLAKLVLTSVLAPLLAGMGVAAVGPHLVSRIAKLATITAYVILLPIVLLLLVKSAGGIVSLFGDGTLLAIAVTVLVGMVLGHALGRPEPGNRLAMAQAAVTRHPGIAGMILSQNAIDRRAMLAVILFLLASLVMSTLYAKWIASRTATTAGNVPKRAM
jgi:BASS family bile acid:Na+ symporter